MTCSPAPMAMARARRIPSSRIFLWELIFWAALFYGSLVPATMVVKKEWFGVPMKYSDVFTLFSGFFYGSALFYQIVIHRKVRSPKALLGATLALFAYGLFTLSIGSLELEDQLAMGFTLLLAAAGPLQAAGLLSMYDEIETKQFLDRLVFFLALLCLLYTAESLFDLGLRSEEGRNVGSDFGIQRVRGPLFGPSTGYLLLLPAIGWGLQSFFSRNRGRLYSVFVAGILLTTLLGLGSRAALILLGAYILTLALLMKDLKRKVLTAVLLVGLSGLAAFLIYGQADTQRLQNFEDNYRKTTHETAWNIIASDGPLPILGGQGYGSIWSWYRRDVLRGELVAVGDNTILTGYGASLYHCHSTLLELSVEFGLIGIAWLIFLAVKIGRLPLVAGGETAWRVFSWSLVISLFALGFDLFLFKEARVNSIWWVFAMAAFQIQPTRESHQWATAGEAISGNSWAATGATGSSRVGSIRVNR